MRSQLRPARAVLVVSAAVALVAGLAPSSWASSGDHLWTHRYNGPGHGTDDAHDVAVSADGTKVFVTGESLGATTGRDFATVAYDATDGHQLWLSRYTGPGTGNDSAVAVAVAGNSVFVTGSSPPPGTVSKKSVETGPSSVR